MDEAIGLKQQTLVLPSALSLLIHQGAITDAAEGEGEGEKGRRVC